MSLETGKRIHRRSWTVLPISDATISRVEALAEHEGMPPVDHEGSIIEYDPDELVDESAYDRNYQPPLAEPAEDHQMTTDAYTSESDFDDDADDIGHHDNFDSVPPPPTPNEERSPHSNKNVERMGPEATETEERESAPTTATGNDRQNEERNSANGTPTIVEPATPPPPTGEPATLASAGNNEEREEAARKAALRSAARSKRKSLRNKTGHADFTYRFGFAQIAQSLATAAATLEPPNTNDDLSSLPAVQKAIYGLLFTQMTAQKGIKKHGQAAFDALRKEFEQFRTMDVLEPLDAFKLTDEQKAESLRALSVIKEKRDGNL
jgi:hypothetical protein